MKKKSNFKFPNFDFSLQCVPRELYFVFFFLNRLLSKKKKIRNKKYAFTVKTSLRRLIYAI